MHDGSDMFGLNSVREYFDKALPAPLNTFRSGALVSLQNFNELKKQVALALVEMPQFLEPCAAIKNTALCLAECL